MEKKKASAFFSKPRLILLLFVTVACVACKGKHSSDSQDTPHPPAIKPVLSNASIVDNTNTCSDCSKWDTSTWQDALQRRDKEKFSQVGFGKLRSFLSQSRFEEVNKLLAGYGEVSSVSLYRKEGRKSLILLVQGKDRALPTKVISVSEAEIGEFELPQHIFMDDSDVLSAITDIDNNGSVEFWLEGTANEGAGGQSTEIIEARGNYYCVRVEPGDMEEKFSGFRDGPGKAALFNNPTGIVSDETNLYVADTYNNKIRKIEIATGNVATLAGSGANCFRNGAGTAASFNNPQGLVLVGKYLYVADTLNNKVRRIETATGVVTTLAGSGTAGYAEGVGMQAKFDEPYGITSDGTDLYVTETNNTGIRKIEIATGAVSSFFGTPRQKSDVKMKISDSYRKAAFAPQAIVHSGGDLFYVQDWSKPVISKIKIPTRAVTPLAGSGGLGIQDGVGAAASLGGITNMASDGHSLFMASVQGYVRKVDIASGTVSTIPSTLATQECSQLNGIYAGGQYLYVTTRCGQIHKVDTASNTRILLAGYEPAQPASSNVITPPAGAQEARIILDGELKLNKQPTERSAAKGLYARKGDLIWVYEVRDGWVLIKYPGREMTETPDVGEMTGGWVPKSRFDRLATITSTASTKAAR